MNKRPLSISVVGWLFVCVACVGLVGGVWKFLGTSSSANASGSNNHALLDLALVVVSEIVAGVGGAFVLRGANWARWMLAAWMGFHIVLSILHSPFELIVHCVLFAGVLYLLFCPPASEYLRRANRAIVESEGR